MIELDIAEYCHNCPDFEPEKVVVRSLLEVCTYVQCANKGRCRAIATRIKQELAGKEISDEHSKNSR